MSGLPIAEIMPATLTPDAAERLAALVDAHYGRLYRLARRLAPADQARDLVQETFLKAARRPAAVPADPPGAEAWLVRMLVNLRRDEWRKAQVRTRHDDAIGRRSERTSGDAEAVLVARATVWRALDVLAPRRRAVIVMHELEGLPIAAIASLLGITAITVRWHLSVGRRELARFLESAGGLREQR